MKTIAALLIALVLLLTLSLPALAEEETQPWKFSNTGIILNAPAKFSQTQGMLYPMDAGEINPDRKVACAFILYLPLSEEDRALITQAGTTQPNEEQTQRLIEILSRGTTLYTFFAVGNSQTFEDVHEEILKGDSVGNYVLDELGQAGEYRFYLLTPRLDSESVANSLAQFPESCRDEYIDLLKDTDAVKAAVTVQEPAKPGANAVGTVLSFELSDFNGEPVRSEDLFAGHKVTLVNLWASWCHPCAAEMPGLEALWQEYGAKGAGVIGICLDAYKEKALTDAKKVVAESGVTYPILACTKDLETVLIDSVVAMYPTTVFVNEKGEIIGEPIGGVQLEAYGTVLEQYLAE